MSSCGSHQNKSLYNFLKQNLIHKYKKEFQQNFLCAQIRATIKSDPYFLQDAIKLQKINEPAKAGIDAAKKFNSKNVVTQYHLTDRCNNQQLISRLLQERGKWTRSEGKNMAEVNLIWGYLNLPQLSRLKGKQVLGRVKGSNKMTDKGLLYQNVTRYCEKNNINLNFLPITFHLNRDGPAFALKENIRQFVQFFNYVKDHTNLANTWIMKPTNLNQGRDIHLFNSFHSLAKILNGRRAESSQNLDGFVDNHRIQVDRHLEEYTRMNRSLILQKYIENPLLLQGHKFDIRVWVLLDHMKQFYIFQEGYLRFTSQPYKLNALTLADNFMHLTNHALQKHSPNYSKFHSIQPMSVLKSCLVQKGKEGDYEIVMDRIKEIIVITMKACLSPDNKSKNVSFQLFGFDFLIDRQLNVRLIQANCNPAITLDCPLLEELVPKMLNDAFKLTVDKIFNTKSSNLYHVPRLRSDNAWTMLGNLNISGEE